MAGLDGRRREALGGFPPARLNRAPTRRLTPLTLTLGQGPSIAGTHVGELRRRTAMTLSTPTGPAIEVVGLTKAYGDQVVLDGLDLTVPRGTVSALLGPNGAGKTTTVQILSTLLPPDGGLVRVLGHDLLGEPDAVRAGIGVTGQFSAVDDLLTGAENLTLMGDLHHLSRGERSRRTTELVEQLDLADVVGRPALTLSVPGDGHVSSLRGVLDRLELAAVGVADLSMHTPDLDDVFLALTGQREQEGTLR